MFERQQRALERERERAHLQARAFSDEVVQAGVLGHFGQEGPSRRRVLEVPVVQPGPRRRLLDLHSIDSPLPCLLSYPHGAHYRSTAGCSTRM